MEIGPRGDSVILQPTIILSPADEPEQREISACYTDQRADRRSGRRTRTPAGLETGRPAPARPWDGALARPGPTPRATSSACSKPVSTHSEQSRRHGAVTVVGAGVVGLSVAHRLAGDGHRVTVLADQPAVETVSAVAAAIWFPYAIENSPESMVQLTASRRKFEAIARDPATGVLLRSGVNVERVAEPDRGWIRAVGDVDEVAAADLPAGALSGAGPPCR